MVQTLKRVYLYTAATFALLFTAGVSIILLNTFLNLAGMLSYYLESDGTIETEGMMPDSQQVTQSVVLFLVTVVLVGGLFAGGHYWLIRRDARSDPGADGGAVRHFFLNALMALAALVGVPTTLAFLGGLDQTEGSHDPAIALSFALVSGLVFLYIFLERRRVDPIGRAATIIRQIQENLVQAILLIIASVVFAGSVSAVIRYFLVNAGTVAPPECFSFSGPGVFPCTPLPQPLLSPILTALFALAAVGLYVWLGAWSRGAVLQRVLWYAALGYGLIWLLYGVAQAVYTGLAPLFGNANAGQESLNSSLPFVSQILTGLLIMVPYGLWLRRLAARVPRLQVVVQQGMLAIAAALSAGFFLAGLILLLQALVERLVPAGQQVEADSWAGAVGVLVAGLGYPFLWLALARSSNPARGGPTIPRRVYVLVLLASTAIGALIAAVFMVYQIVASALGLASANALIARQSAVILVVLGAMALYHLWVLRVDLRASHAQAAAQPVPAPVVAQAGAPQEATLPVGATETLEAILQQVYTRALEPSSAAARIRSLPKL